MELFSQTILDIAEDTTEKVASLSRIGLMDGRAGTALMLAYVGRHFEDVRYIKASYDIINYCIENLEPNTPSSFMGISGIGWVIQHLVNINLFNDGSKQLLEDLDGYLLQTVENEPPYYDLLNGFIGKGLYFFERQATNKNLTQLEVILDLLESTSLETKADLTWKVARMEDSKTQYCVGFCHGVPSILSYLCLLYENNIFRKRVYKMIDKSSNWLISTMRSAPNTVSHFPDVLPETEIRTSRLAWCYGDLSISIALFRAARCTQNLKINEIALKTAKDTALRKLDSSQVYQEKYLIDTGFCHGVSGIAHQFNKLYRYTKLPEIDKARNYWFELLLRSKTQDAYKDHIGGFVSRTVEDYDMNKAIVKWAGSANLLEGTAGINLSLLSNISNQSLNWDRLFLLDLN
jgi:class I lanthipeptide synthase